MKPDDNRIASKLQSGPPHYTLPGHKNGASEQPGQEEHGAQRNPTTSSVARTQ